MLRAQQGVHNKGEKARGRGQRRGKHRCSTKLGVNFGLSHSLDVHDLTHKRGKYVWRILCTEAVNTLSRRRPAHSTRNMCH